MKKLLTLCIAIFLNLYNASAAEVYVLDPLHTDITWSVDNLGFSKQTGKFNKSSGSIVIDQKNPKNNSVIATIKISSIQTGITALDNFLKSENFFNIIKYPEAKFVSTVVNIQNNLINVSGNLTIAGVTKTAVFNGKINKVAINHENKKQTAGFSINTIIRRSDFGISQLIPNVADQVLLNIEAQAILDTSIAPNKTDNTKSIIDDGLFNNQKPWQIVSETSLVKFKTSQNGYSINGSLKIAEGKVVFDPQNLNESTISLDLDMSSLTCSIFDAVPILKSSKWLNSDNFPRANFTSTNFSKNNEGNYVAIGYLALKNIRMPVSTSFYIQYYSDVSATATGKAIIKLSDFAIGEKNLPIADNIDDEVEIEFTVQASKNARQITYSYDSKDLPELKKIRD